MATPPTVLSWRLGGLLLLVFAVHAVSAFWHVFHGSLNADEGFYALAARAVWQGELPYRDFGYTQMPLLPYVNGLAFQLTGSGLFEQRAVNGLWGALTLVLAVLWLARRTSIAWALGLAVLFSLSAPWMYFIHLGKTYAFTGLIVMTAVGVYTEWLPAGRKTWVLALLATLGIGCRLSSAPFFVVLWLAAFAEQPRQSGRSLLAAILGSLLWPVALVLPFYLAAPEAAYFWTVDLHRLSLPDRNWHLTWLDIVALAPALWLGLTVGLVQAAISRRFPDRREAVVTLAVVLALGTNLLPKGVFEEYGVPLLPPLALVAAMGWWRATAGTIRLRATLVPLALLALNLGVSVALLWNSMPPARRGTWSMFLPLNAPDYNPTLPSSIAQARQAVEQYLPPDRPFVGPQVILAAETGRRVPNILRMGPFTATADYPPVVAARLNLATFPQLEAWFTDPGVPLLAFSKKASLNYNWSMPALQVPAERHGAHWSEIFRRDFLVAYEDADFLLLVRRTAIAPPR